jgi:hypothetical protein
MGKLWELVSWRLESVLGANYAEVYGLEPWVAREKFEEVVDLNLCEDCRRKILKAFDEWLEGWKARVKPSKPVEFRVPEDVWQEIATLSLRVESLEKRLENVEKKLEGKSF